MTYTNNHDWRVFIERDNGKDRYHLYSFMKSADINDTPYFSHLATFNTLLDAKAAASLPHSLELLEEARDIIAKHSLPEHASLIGRIDALLEKFDIPF